MYIQVSHVCLMRTRRKRFPFLTSYVEYYYTDNFYFDL